MAHDHPPGLTHEDGADGRTGGRARNVERERLTEAKVNEVTAAVRGALKKAAHERSTTSWSRLHRQLGSALPPHLHPDDQVAVLAQVDAHTPADEPLLTALVAATETTSTSVQTGEVLLVETVRNTGSHQAIMISCLYVSLGGSCESESA
ncbi:hypothetical protein [Streptomyces canus]|uniref:hypothetical protein n=1 Tax=Streptomyces canus TaxID=58343 RepID=UPI00278ACF8F|nr:hypothetical protein [Streptomyces canus]MDQ0757524.1 hypothetical protein [Streptomyces canus]